MRASVLPDLGDEGDIHREAAARLADRSAKGFLERLVMARAKGLSQDLGPARWLGHGTSPRSVRSFPS